MPAARHENKRNPAMRLIPFIHVPSRLSRHPRVRAPRAAPRFDPARERANIRDARPPGRRREPPVPRRSPRLAYPLLADGGGAEREVPHERVALRAAQNRGASVRPKLGRQVHAGWHEPPVVEHRERERRCRDPDRVLDEGGWVLHISAVGKT